MPTLTPEQLAKLRGTKPKESGANSMSTAQKAAIMTATAASVMTANPAVAQENNSKNPVDEGHKIEVVEQQKTDAIKQDENALNFADEAKKFESQSPSSNDKQEVSSSPEYKKELKNVAWVNDVAAQEEFIDSENIKISTKGKEFKIQSGMVGFDVNFDNGDIGFSVYGDSGRLSKNGNIVISKQEDNSGIEDEKGANRQTYSFRGTKDGKFIVQITDESADYDNFYIDSSKKVGYAYVDKEQLKTLNDVVDLVDSGIKPQTTHLTGTYFQDSGDKDEKKKDRIIYDKEDSYDDKTAYKNMEKEFANATTGIPSLSDEYQKHYADMPLDKDTCKDFNKYIKSLRGLSQSQSNQPKQPKNEVTLTQEQIVGLCAQHNKNTKE